VLSSEVRDTLMSLTGFKFWLETVLKTIPFTYMSFSERGTLPCDSWVEILWFENCHCRVTYFNIMTNFRLSRVNLMFLWSGTTKFMNFLTKEAVAPYLGLWELLIGFMNSVT
jgi:hypothetical protein